MYGNLLTEPLIRVHTRQERSRRATLPEVLGLLAAGDEVIGFPGLAPHQVQAWYCLLVQVAALALIDAGQGDPSDDPGTWSERLRGLTRAYPADEPWTLIVPDVSLPAFFQPPVPEGNLREYAGPILHPDSLDVLVTARNHDVKSSRAVRPDPDQWVFTLACLQTLNGYTGRGNHGIVRMNGGYASRPMVTLVPGPGWGERFRRDVKALLVRRSEILDRHPFSCTHRLLWLEPWDGNAPIPVVEIDPYALEVCRRVRLAAERDAIVAYRKPTQRARVAGEALKGNVGDPWIPVRREDGAALNVGPRGFDYRLVHEILFQSAYAPAPSQRYLPEDPEEMVLWCLALAREQGGTAGLHERWVPIPGRVRQSLLFGPQRESLAAVSRSRVEDAATAERSILKPALLSLAQGDPGTLDFRDRRVEAFVAEFHRAVDQVFFEALWSEWERPPQERRQRWAERLRRTARRVLRRAERSLPVPEARRYRATARAWAILERGFFKHFPELSPEPSEEVAP